MSKYIDGFILIVPKDKTEEYRKMAELGRDSWMKHGALAYYESRGEDMKPNEMGGEKTRAFPEMAGATSNEEVWFSFIIFKSKAHRDEVNAKVNAEMSALGDQFRDFVMPFDMKRMAYGGFETLVEGEV